MFSSMFKVIYPKGLAREVFWQGFVVTNGELVRNKEGVRVPTKKINYLFWTSKSLIVYLLFDKF